MQCPRSGHRSNRGSKFATVLLGSLLAAAPAVNATVRTTKHDLSTTGIDPYSDQPCAFCHTPHSANILGALQAPLWNRFVDQTKAFTVYGSSTMNTVPGNPMQTRSALCLGCHDGTLGTAVVNGYTGSDKHDLVNAPGPGGIPDASSYPNCQRCHPDIYGQAPVTWIGTSLADDHPIAVSYPTAAQDPGFVTPPDPVNGWSDVWLVNGKVECVTCHEPHDATYTPFLRKSNIGSALCTTCHLK